MKVTKVPTPTPSSPSTSTSFVPNSSTHASEGVSSFSRRDPGDPGAYPSDPESEPLALVIIDKLGVEKAAMSHNLRVGFRERHHKRLYEAIDIVPPSTKRACSEGAREESERGIPSMLVPQLDVTGSSSVPTLRKKPVRP